MDGPDEDHEVALTPTTTTARWIALLSPAVAPMISGLLRDAARDVEVDGGVIQDSATQGLLDLACVLLAEEVTEDDRVLGGEDTNDG